MFGASFLGMFLMLEFLIDAIYTREGFVALALDVFLIFLGLSLLLFCSWFLAVRNVVSMPIENRNTTSRDNAIFLLYFSFSNTSFDDILPETAS